MKILVYLAFLLVPVLSKAQPATKDTVIPQKALNRITNNTFSGLVTTNSSAGEVASYVALDPVNASFIAKTTIPLRRSLEKRARALNPEEQIELDPGRFSYLGLSVSGSLIDKKYGVLFSEGSLNSGVTLGAQWNFMPWRPTIRYYLDSWQAINITRLQLVRNYKANYRQLERSMSNNELFQKRFETKLQLGSVERKWQEKQDQLVLLRKSIDSLGTLADSTAWGDRFRVIAKELGVLAGEQRMAEAMLDSIDIRLANDIAGQRTAQQDKLGRDLVAEYDSALNKMEFQNLSLCWFTVLGNYNRKSVNTFNTALPFTSQFGKEKFDAGEVGIAFNQLFRNYEYGRMRFFNISATYFFKKTNLDQLSTVTVNEIKQAASVTGDTIRTISSGRSVYTDPIVSSPTWTLSSHFYYIFGKTPHGIHLFPSVDFPKDKQQIATATLGYLIAFKTTAKDRSVINSELYIRFRDVFNNGEANSGLFKRSEVGLSFTLPFNVF